MPETLPRMPRGQMQADLREQLAYPPTDLDQHKPKRIQLHSLYTRLDQLPAQSVHKPVGRRMQKEPKLVGEEAMAAEMVSLQRPLEVLYPSFRFSPPDVPVVELLRPIGAAGYHKAGVGAFL